MTNYNDGKWHGWNGGECPVHPETVVEVTNGAGLHRQKSMRTNWCAVIAFRVVKEYKEPREFWINPETKGMNTKPFPGYIHVREVIE